MEAEVFVIVDSEGSYVATADFDAIDELASEHGLEAIRRVIAVTIKMPIPDTIRVAVELPPESSEATVTVK